MTPENVQHILNKNNEQYDHYIVSSNQCRSEKQITKISRAEPNYFESTKSLSKSDELF